MRRRLLFVLLPLIAFGWLLVALIQPSAPWVDQTLALGILFGTMFGHATLASAWTALGPGPLIRRLSLSIAWLVAVLIAFAMNPEVRRAPGEAELVIGGCLVGQWILMQLPLWGLAFAYGLQVRRHVERQAFSHIETQFSIRQLMIITAVVAVILGVGRAVVLSVAHAYPDQLAGEPIIFIFLGVAGILMSLPLVLAALLPRYSLRACLVASVFIVVATWCEYPLIRTLVTGAGPKFWDFAMINGFQSLWLLTVIGTLRRGGYALFGRDKV